MIIVTIIINNTLTLFNKRTSLTTSPFYYGLNNNMKHKIKESDDHIINTKTRAIINNNDIAYEQAKLRNMQIIDKANDMKYLKSTVEKLTNDMGEIQSLLKQLINGKDNNV